MTRRAAWIGAGMALLGALAACAPPDVTFGASPNTAALGRLNPGLSTEADVIRALGPPRGHGEALVSPDMKARRLLFYELVKARQGEVDLKMLIVLIDDGRYDGHLWFSSSEIIEQKDLF